MCMCVHVPGCMRMHMHVHMCVCACMCSHMSSKISCEGGQMSSFLAEPVGFLIALGVQGPMQTVMVPRVYRLYLTLKIEGLQTSTTKPYLFKSPYQGDGGKDPHANSQQDGNEASQYLCPCLQIPVHARSCLDSQLPPA